MRVYRKPAYSKLTNHLESLIAANVYTPGDKLPTRRELAEQFGMTSYAVQQGFEYLKDKGLVLLKHGSGVYVAPGAVKCRKPAGGSRFSPISSTGNSTS